MNGSPGRLVRLRTASNKAKAFAQYEELRRSGQVKAAVVIAELNDGSWQVLGQRMTPGEMAQALVVGAEGLSHVEGNRAVERIVIKPEPHQAPLSTGETAGLSLKAKAITTDAEGILVPPYGENFISCGECKHPRWYVLHTDADDQISRVACAHCGNEVIQVPVEL